MQVDDKLDKWQLLLNTSLQDLKDCQKRLNLESCFDCKELLGCDTREKYVNSVYTSMNRGEDGGFEF
jgi:hypothetical protein